MKEIKTIGIIGAGTMGSGIASCFALNGFNTMLYDLKAEIIKNAVDGIMKSLSRLVEKGKITTDKLQTTNDNISQSTELTRFKDCDIIIEAAVEDIQIKKNLFKELEGIVSEDTILATNTSSFSVTAIASAIEKKERVIGMHFFNPANIMKLVEVVRTDFTSDDVLSATLELSKKLGKVPVVCKDTPAFIVNRVARSFYGEALKILSEAGTEVKTIDTIMKEEGGFAMGPFELMDLIGIDVNFAVTKSVYEAFFHDQKYKPSPIQQKMVEAGMLGRKTKRGFYSYN